MQLPMPANFYAHHKSELGTLILAGACGMMPVTLLTKADNEENYARVDVKKSRSLAVRLWPDAVRDSLQQLDLPN